MSAAGSAGAALALAAALAAAPPRAAADAAPGAYLAATCAGCHPPQRSAREIPPLGGTDPAALSAALTAYRDGTRSDAAMRAVAASLSDAEIAALAAHFAALGPEQ